MWEEGTRGLLAISMRYAACDVHTSDEVITIGLSITRKRLTLQQRGDNSEHQRHNEVLDALDKSVTLL
jgi:hypothetical protein